MNDVSIVSILAFGFVLGLKHAVEADHVAAVSTIASEHSGIIGLTSSVVMFALKHA